MPTVKSLALAAILALGLAACGNNDEAETTAETGAAVDTSAMSGSAPTTVNPTPDAMGTTGAMGSAPGAPAGGMGATGSSSGEVGTPPNNPPPTQAPMK